MKIYLDTNIIFDFFLNLANSAKTNEELAIPQKLRFLLEEQNKKKIEIFTSVLVQAEVARRLKSEFGFEADEIDEFWNKFITIANIDNIEDIEFNWFDLYKITREIPLKKRVTNLQHLLIAKQYNLWFLTGDGEILRKLKGFYDKIIGYPDLRKMSEI